MMLHSVKININTFKVARELRELRSLITYRLLGPPNYDEIINNPEVCSEEPPLWNPVDEFPKLSYPILKLRFGYMKEDYLPTELLSFGQMLG